MKYYAVKRGRQPGIYENWSSCQGQIYKYSGAVFKSFEDRAAAEEYLQQEETGQPINENLPAAYIDGSFSKNTGCYGYGGFISNGRECHIIQGTGSNPEYITERNIAGELLGTLAVMHKCHDLGIHEINLYFDYAGIEEYTTGYWKAKTPLAIYYRDTMDLLAGHYNLQVHFIKLKGHTGIEGNEIADYLAKEATGAQLRKKDIKTLAEFRARQGELNS